MKRFLTAAAALFVLAFQAFAQNYDYKPRESWPYLLEEFSYGEATNFGREISSEGYFNICVADGSLHYIGDGVIMVADMKRLQTVRIGTALYINRLGKMKQVVAEAKGGKFLLRAVTVDEDELAKQDIGLGVRSALASTQKVNGLAGHSVNMELQAAIADSKDGAVLPLKEKFTFLLGNKEYEASKKGLLSIPGIDPAKAKAFLKAEKIKWHSSSSLQKVLLFIAENAE